MQVNQKATSYLLDQEKIYALLINEDWKSLLSFVWNHSNLINSDDILKNAIETCEQFFFSNLEKEKKEPSFANNLATFHMLHSHNKYLLSNQNFKSTILELVKFWETKDLNQAKNFAIKFPVVN